MLLPLVVFGVSVRSGWSGECSYVGFMLLPMVKLLLLWLLSVIGSSASKAARDAATYRWSGRLLCGVFMTYILQYMVKVVPGILLVEALHGAVRHG